MNIRRLEYFLSVVDTGTGGGASGAANHLPPDAGRGTYRPLPAADRGALSLPLAAGRCRRSPAVFPAPRGLASPCGVWVM